MKEQRKGLVPANKVRLDSTVKICTFEKSTDMERIVNLHIQKLSEGLYLATSDSIQGLVAQGRTISETIEIARDIARKLIEAREGHFADNLTPASDTFDYPLVIGL